MTAVLFSTFLFTMAVGVPIAITIGLATLIAVVWDGRFSAMLIPQKFFAGLDSFPLLAIPFFILAAEMMSGGRSPRCCCASPPPASGTSAAVSATPTS